MPQSPHQKRRRIRRHRAPFPLTENGELFEGGEILREIEGDLAVVLWKSYKNAMLWAGAPRGERVGLFAEGAGERRRDDVGALGAEARVAGPLLALAGLLDAPEAFESAEAADACRSLSQWAAEQGASATALLFMQAAALSDPLDAEAAVAVGRMARNRAEYARAETWFRRAIVISRTTGAWSAYSQAFVGLGKVHWRRGALPAARRCMVRAYRAATRHHLHELRGWALQDLGAIALDANRWEEAQGYVRSAWRIYGATHPLSARLAHNIAYAWAGQGWFAEATRALQAIGPRFTAPMQRLQWAGSLARASGGAGERDLFRFARAEIESLGNDPSLASILPEPLLDVSSGAASLGEWELAEESAATALRIAKERGEARIRFAAEAALEALHAERAAQRATRSLAPETVEEFVAELIAVSEDTPPGQRVLAAAPA